MVLGKTLHKLKLRTHDDGIPLIRKCEFVSEEECVACLSDSFFRGHFLQLLNVKSGDLLSQIGVERYIYSLAACPRERLVVIGCHDSKVKFQVTGR